MDHDAVIEVLNELLAAESASLLPRLRESRVFVSWASADEVDDVQRILDEDQEHQGWIVEAINRAGGYPLPVRADINTTNLHYIELGFLLPRVLADRRKLLSYYESASGQVASHEASSEVVSRIAGRVRKHVDLLDKLTERAIAQQA